MIMDLEKNKDKTPKFPKFQEGGIVTKETLYLLGREDHEIPLPIGYKEEKDNNLLEAMLEDFKKWKWKIKKK